MKSVTRFSSVREGIYRKSCNFVFVIVKCEDIRNALTHSGEKKRGNEGYDDDVDMTSYPDLMCHRVNIVTPHSTRLRSFQSYISHTVPVQSL